MRFMDYQTRTKMMTGAEDCDCAQNRDDEERKCYKEYNNFMGFKSNVLNLRKITNTKPG